ncbi:uncharacterized protein VP01_637g12 [Puccinia sorghi]|uniref:Uncharacterized protein n=1 Tax=Puccinia sorghi TaxID=27349 RepID=A0A0L6UFY8_9BASI|nr:uncharacterized protein VP01_637g12 [Puccinia sorghi]
MTIWQIPMIKSLPSCPELLQSFGLESEIPDQDLVPKLIHSTTRHLTISTNCAQTSKKNLRR